MVENVDDGFVDAQLPGIELALGPLRRRDRMYLAIGTPALRMTVAAQNSWNSFVGREAVASEPEGLAGQQARIEAGRSTVAVLGVAAATAHVCLFFTAPYHY